MRLDRNRVSYSKTMREKAKSNGELLFTIDLETPNFRTTLQGPITQGNARIVRKAMLMLNGLSEADADKHLIDHPEAA